MTTKQKKQHVKMPAAFNVEVLAARQEIARSRYLNGYVDRETHNFVFPAAERLIFSNIEDLQRACIEAGKQGRQLYKGPRIQAMPGLYTLDLLKPEAQLQEELGAIDKQVEAEYLAELEAFAAEQVELLIAQLEAQFQREQAQAEAEAKEARLSAFKEEAERVLLKKEVA